MSKSNPPPRPSQAQPQAERERQQQPEKLPPCEVIEQPDGKPPTLRCYAAGIGPTAEFGSDPEAYSRSPEWIRGDLVKVARQVRRESAPTSPVPTSTQTAASPLATADAGAARSKRKRNPAAVEAAAAARHGASRELKNKARKLYAQRLGDAKFKGLTMEWQADEIAREVSRARSTVITWIKQWRSEQREQ